MLRVRVWVGSVAAFVMVLMESVLVLVSMTELRFPKSVDTMVEMSFTVLLVANAPRLIGVYGLTRNGLLLFDAKFPLSLEGLGGFCFGTYTTWSAIPCATLIYSS